jgi:hypothetical protein
MELVVLEREMNRGQHWGQCNQAFRPKSRSFSDPQRFAIFRRNNVKETLNHHYPASTTTIGPQ